MAYLSPSDLLDLERNPSPPIPTHPEQAGVRAGILNKLNLNPTDNRCPVLAFRRFGKKVNVSAIVLVPDTLAWQLPPPTRHFIRSKAATSAAASTGDDEVKVSFKPGKRQKRTEPKQVDADEQEIAIEHTTAHSVYLKVTHTRMTNWGIDLRLLGFKDRVVGITPTHMLERFSQWFADHGLKERNHAPETAVALRGAFMLSLAQREIRKPELAALPLLRFPLLHNHRTGFRFLLQCDEQRMGSPADIHVLIFPEGQVPELRGHVPPEKITADERKPGLLLAYTYDYKVRLYQPTEEQWGEWEKARHNFDIIPEPFLTPVLLGLEAAKTLRQRLHPAAIG